MHFLLLCIIFSICATLDTNQHIFRADENIQPMKARSMDVSTIVEQQFYTCGHYSFYDSYILKVSPKGASDSTSMTMSVAGGSSLDYLKAEKILYYSSNFVAVAGSTARSQDNGYGGTTRVPSVFFSKASLSSKSAVALYVDTGYRNGEELTGMIEEGSDANYLIFGKAFNRDGNTDEENQYDSFITQVSMSSSLFAPLRYTLRIDGYDLSITDIKLIDGYPDTKAYTGSIKDRTTGIEKLFIAKCSQYISTESCTFFKTFSSESSPSSTTFTRGFKFIDRIESLGFTNLEVLGITGTYNSQTGEVESSDIIMLKCKKSDGSFVQETKISSTNGLKLNPSSYTRNKKQNTGDVIIAGTSMTNSDEIDDNDRSWYMKIADDQIFWARISNSDSTERTTEFIEDIDLYPFDSTTEDQDDFILLHGTVYDKVSNGYSFETPIFQEISPIRTKLYDPFETSLTISTITSTSRFLDLGKVWTVESSSNSYPDLYPKTQDLSITIGSLTPLLITQTTETHPNNYCEGGEYFNENSNSCEECPKGSYRSHDSYLGFNDDYRCFTCQSGYTTVSIGSDGSDDCSVCSLGYGLESGTCKICPINTYHSVEELQSCQSCVTGANTNGETGSTSSNACQCPAGYELNDQGTACSAEIESFLFDGFDDFTLSSISCNGVGCLNSDVCNHHGTCQYSGCSCFDEWDGINCNNSIIPTCNGYLSTNPMVCSGNGPCSVDGCSCAGGWSGDNCEDPSCDVCIHGACIEPNKCDCDSGYEGVDCNTPICSNKCIQGVCDSPESCTCYSGWTGDTCNVAICSPDCVNGECTSPDKCSCSIGYAGTICSEYDCNPECGYHQECTGPNICSCDDGYEFEGNECVPLCPNLPTNAICIAPSEFSCESGYYGDSCEKAECSNCANTGSKCVSPGVCQCESGYTGDGITCEPQCLNCDDPKKECISPEVCSCKSGYVLENEECVKRCDNCSLNADCLIVLVDGNLESECRCRDGYVSNESGECVFGCEECITNSFCCGPNTCCCKDGYVGDDCHPVCDNCTGIHQECLTPKECTCEDGWIGDGCLQSECKEELCSQNSFCNESHKCECYSGWEGVDCDVPICDCEENAVCSSPGVCICNDGFHLINNECIKDIYCFGINFLDKNVCNGHGYCKESNECECDEGYFNSDCSGVICQKDCYNGVCSYPGICTCSDDWVGDQCDIKISNSSLPLVKCVNRSVIIDAIHNCNDSCCRNLKNSSEMFCGDYEKYGFKNGKLDNYWENQDITVSVNILPKGPLRVVFFNEINFDFFKTNNSGIIQITKNHSQILKQIRNVELHDGYERKLIWRIVNYQENVQISFYLEDSFIGLFIFSITEKKELFRIPKTNCFDKLTKIQIWNAALSNSNIKEFINTRKTSFCISKSYNYTDDLIEISRL